jgi:predicted GNAT family acetyltransferase
VDVLRASSVAGFMDLAGEFLEAREAEHNLIFGICANIEADPTQYEGAPYLATVLHGDRVVGAAIRTPPWRLVLSVMDHPGAAHRLVDDLMDEPLPGVIGPSMAAEHFAEGWTRVTGAPARLRTNERAFQLRRVIPPRPAPGRMVRSDPSHRDVVAAWAKAFNDEALDGAPPQDWDLVAERWIKGIGRTAYLWVDDGRVVSLSGVGGPTPHGIRVGPVYTPPEARGRGYASNLVAELSQLQLDAGRRFVFLFTDLANPTSNKIYQDIGFEPVIDVDEYEFSPRA